MDTPNYLRFLTIATSVSYFFASLHLLWRHNMYTTFVLGVYGICLSILIFLYENYEKFYNSLIEWIPPLEKNKFKGFLLIIIGSLYLGPESEDLCIISGAFLILCGIFHILHHYINRIFNIKYEVGHATFERPIPPENDKYDELVM